MQVQGLTDDCGHRSPCVFEAFADIKVPPPYSLPTTAYSFSPLPSFHHRNAAALEHLADDYFRDRSAPAAIAPSADAFRFAGRGSYGIFME